MRRLFGINLEVGHDKKIVLTPFFFFIISRIKLIKCASFVLYHIRAAAFILGWRSINFIVPNAALNRGRCLVQQIRYGIKLMLSPSS